MDPVMNMIFFIQKTILYLLMPPSGPMLVILAGFLLTRTRYVKLGKIFMVSGSLILYLMSTSIASNVLIRPLENDYPPLQSLDMDNVSAVVVLTSGVKDLSHIGLTMRPDVSSIARLEYGIELYRRLRGVPFIISGGKADPAKPDLSIGKALGKVAAALGIPEDDLIIEDASINTYEGALQVSRIFKGNGRKIVLVTSAFHMGRAIGFFKKAGFDVIPASTDYRGEKMGLNLYSLIPSSGNLATSGTAVYEYLTRIWYFFTL